MAADAAARKAVGVGHPLLVREENLPLDALTAQLGESDGPANPGRSAGSAPSHSVGDAPPPPVGDAPSPPVGDAPSRPVGDAPSRPVGDAPSHPVGSSLPPRTLKDGSSSRVQTVRWGKGREGVLKHYFPSKALDPRDWLGRSKAVRSLLAAEALQRRGFAVAQPLAAWSKRGEGSDLLMENLDDFLPFHLAVLELEGEERQDLLDQVAQLVRRLHLAGVAYRDLKPSNLMVRVPLVGEEDLRFVDHDRNRFSRDVVSEEVALRDLAALHAGLPPQVRASERMKALLRYDSSLAERARWSRLLPAVLQEAAERRHRWIPRRLLAGPS